MKVKIAQQCLTLCDPMGYIVHGILQARILEWVAFPPPGDLPNRGIKPRSPTLQADSLPAQPLGKPKNTGVGSLSLLQRIFPTQESNWGLLHCRWILYQLSYQGSLKEGLQTCFFLLFMNDYNNLALQSNRKRIVLDSSSLDLHPCTIMNKKKKDTERSSQLNQLRKNSLYSDLHHVPSSPPKLISVAQEILDYYNSLI